MAGQSTPDYETYYVPEQSRFAICASLGLFLSVFGAATYINDKSGKFSAGEETNSGLILILGLLFFIGTLFFWFRQAVIENRKGLNSAQLKRSYAIGMQWFIFSEVMFFAAFFGALFYVRNLAGPWLASEGHHSSNFLLWGDFQFSWPLMETPQQVVGGVANQVPANTGVFEGPGQNLSFPGWSNLLGWLPLWNTIVLLTSSFTVHIAHLGLKEGNRRKFNIWLGLTVALGLSFVYLQYMEYHHAIVEMGLTLAAGTYGTTFFMLTGFHGVHVIMGTIMLLVQWLRSTTAGHFTAQDHFGFEASSWYWHFVDVVWVGLFLFVYIL